MREILFRGKRTDNKQWVEGFYTLIGEENPNAYIIKNNGHRVRVAHKSVSEYTGLTDKNGKKIFEGDIVENEYSEGHYQYFKVIYDERTYRWEVENKYGMLGQLCNVLGECEVIGNIHDNPELIERR